MKAYQFLNGKSGVKYSFDNDEQFGKRLIVNPTIDVHGFSIFEKDEIKNGLERKAKSDHNIAVEAAKNNRRDLKYHKFGNYRKFWKDGTKNNSSITGTGILLGLALGAIVGVTKYFFGEDVGDASLYGGIAFLGVNAFTQLRDEYTRRVNKKRLVKEIVPLKDQRMSKERISDNVKKSDITFHFDEEAKDLVEGRISLGKENPFASSEKINEVLEKFYFSETSKN